MSRIALIGCGRWGRLILRDLRSLGCDVVVATRSPENRTAAREGGASVTVPQIDDLPAVDGAVVATPTRAHHAAVMALLPRQVPVFVEKPLTADLSQAREIVEAAPARVFVMDKWRYHPGVAEMARLARRGSLGRVVGLRTVRVGWNAHPRDVDSTWHLIPHDLAIALEVLGSLPEPQVAVSEPNGEGVIAVLGHDPWFTVEVSEMRPVYAREITLVCREGMAVLSGGYAESLQIIRGGDGRPADTTLVPLSTDLPLLAELRAFVEHVRGGPPPRSSAIDALAIVETITAIRTLAGLDR